MLSMLYALDLRSRLTRLSLAAAILVCPAKAGPAILDLGTLGGPTSTANAISPDGSAVAGTSDTASGIPHPFLWRQNSKKMIDLGPDLPGNSGAYAVNATGSVVVGSAHFPASRSGPQTQPFRWQSGNLQPLAPLGAAEGESGMGAAYGVNGDGSLIVGESTTAPSGLIHATLWTAGGAPLDLDAKAPNAVSTAFAISQDGTAIAGTAGSATPVVWTFKSNSWNRKALPLPRGVSFQAGCACAVNADGSLIAGFGADSKHYDHALVWSRTGAVYGLLIDAVSSNGGAGPAQTGMYLSAVAGSQSSYVAGGALTSSQHGLLGRLLSSGNASLDDVNADPGLQPLLKGRVLLGIGGVASTALGTSLATTIETEAAGARHAGLVHGLPPSSIVMPGLGSPACSGPACTPPGPPPAVNIATLIRSLAQGAEIPVFIDSRLQIHYQLRVLSWKPVR